MAIELHPGVRASLADFRPETCRDESEVRDLVVSVGRRFADLVVAGEISPEEQERQEGWLLDAVATVLREHNTWQQWNQTTRQKRQARPLIVDMVDDPELHKREIGSGRAERLRRIRRWDAVASWFYESAPGDDDDPGGP